MHNELTPAKRVIAINDLSGFGKCSLTVALPILSALNAEAVAMPTAVLSTHTGGITGFSLLGMTEEMAKFSAHWKSLGLHFDSVYSGWLDTAEQAQIVREVFDWVGPQALRLVDPVLGDNGKLYGVLTEEHVRSMRSLCAMANLITPNMTEACLVLGRPFQGDRVTPASAREMLEALCALGPQMAVLTGICTADNTIGAATLDQNGVFSLYETERIPGNWHGAGDVFTSAVLGALLCGNALADCVRIAADFTHDALVRSYAMGADQRFGLDFERGLGKLRRDAGLD